ncbi:hypothetical protein Tco_1576337 [Tanacetum coccineum]
MSNHEQPTPSHPKSDVRNTTGKNKQTLQDSVRTTSAVDLEEFCEKHYEKLLPIMADKRALGHRNQRILSPRQYRQEDRDALEARATILASSRSISAHSDSRQESSRYTKNYSESEDSEGGHWKSKLRRKKPSVEDDDLSQPRVCAETDPFTSRIRHFDFPKTRMPSHVKTYNGSEDPEDHLKIFQVSIMEAQRDGLFRRLT